MTIFYSIWDESGERRISAIDSPLLVDVIFEADLAFWIVPGTIDE